MAKKEKTIISKGYEWHFIQTSGLVHLQITSIDDVLNLDKLDQKLWVALACPVVGLEFSSETLEALDTDKNGRVRAPEILEAVGYIKKYFKKPEVIMTAGDSIPLDALGEEPFACGHSPLDSAKAILDILGKKDASEISLADIASNDKLYSPAVINGDGVLPAEAVTEEAASTVVKDIITCTGGADDISGAKGITRAQWESFFADVRALKQWHESSNATSDAIFFLKDKTEAAAAAFCKVRDKINEFFLRCAITSYDKEVAEALRKREGEVVTGDGSLSMEELLQLPLAESDSTGILSFDGSINPAWRADIAAFVDAVIVPLGASKTAMSETAWRKIEAAFAPYLAWYAARPANAVSAPEHTLSLARLDEILASDAEKVIAAYLDTEDKHPHIAQASAELKKMLLYRRDFVTLLRNFVSFEDFYDAKKSAVFQCGTLYIDGRSCDLCFRVTDAAKHATMSPLSQCYLLYCDCVQPATGEKMAIAALMSAGSSDNILVGRNGLFYDRDGRDWDATITKIVENPISIREAFWSPYKKLLRMIQERIAKTAAAAEGKVSDKMSSAVENPKDAAEAAKTTASTAATAPKKTDVGTIAALSVAFTGIATVVGGLLQAFFGLGWWIPVGIIGIILAISFPSMFIAWLKLRQRNIAPVLDASGWAVNGNVRVNIPLGASLTHVAKRPAGSKLDAFDPFSQKKFPVKRVILCVLLAALIITFLVLVIKNPKGLSGLIQDVKNLFLKFVPHKG